MLSPNLVAAWYLEDDQTEVDRVAGISLIQNGTRGSFNFIPTGLDIDDGGLDSITADISSAWGDSSAEGIMLLEATVEGGSVTRVPLTLNDGFADRHTLNLTSAERPRCDTYVASAVQASITDATRDYAPLVRFRIAYSFAAGAYIFASSPSTGFPDAGALSSEDTSGSSFVPTSMSVGENANQSNDFGGVISLILLYNTADGSYPAGRNQFLLDLVSGAFEEDFSEDEGSEGGGGGPGPGAGQGSQSPISQDLAYLAWELERWHDEQRRLQAELEEANRIERERIEAELAGVERQIQAIREYRAYLTRMEGNARPELWVPRTKQRNVTLQQGRNVMSRVPVKYRNQRRWFR